MTKRQVIASLRQRVENVRDVSNRALSECAKLDDDCSYCLGRIDAYDLVLQMLCDYD